MAEERDWRQRSLELPEEGPLRGRLRDADEERLRRIWLKGIIRQSLMWVAAIGAALAVFRTEIVNSLWGG